MAPSTIRLATASPGTQATTAETLTQLEHFAQRSAAKNVDILLLPEAYVGGYPRGTHFGCVIGSRSREGRDEYLHYFQSAVDLGDTVGGGAGAGQAWVNRELPSDVVPRFEDGKVVLGNRGDGTREELERIARETGVFIVTGLIEKAGGSLYCAVVYVCPKLGMVGKRRKVMPTGTERLVWAQGSPATLRAVSTTIRGIRINLASAICWENYMPLVRQALYAQNINLYLAPTADGRDAWLPLLRTIAIEGRCFVISSNMCVRSSGGATATTTTTTLPPTNGNTTTTANFHPAADSSHAQDTEGSATADEDAYPFPPSTGPRSSTHRRSSCMTEEGFEIALPPKMPSPPPALSPSPTLRQLPPRRRRRSVFDDDGNEIVLSLEQSPSSSLPPGGDRDRNRTRLRRPSVFDEDGNEIVLCALGGAVGGDGHAKEGRGQPKPPATGPGSATAGEFASRGGSAIVSPFGDVLAGPQWEDDEGLIYADVDFEDCIRGRLDLDTAGSYSRNDSFKFEVEGLELTPLPY